MLMLNASPMQVRIPELGVDLAPHETVELPDGYCLPRRSPGGTRIPAIVEGLAPQLRPADPEVHKAWLKCPETAWYQHGQAAAKPKEAFMSEGLPEGVAEILAAQSANSVAQQREAQKAIGEQPTAPAPAVAPARKSPRLGRAKKE